MQEQLALAQNLLVFISFKNNTIHNFEVRWTNHFVHNRFQIYISNVTSHFDLCFSLVCSWEVSLKWSRKGETASCENAT